MRRPKKDIQLTSYDELLGLEETPEKSMNQVVEIDLAKLYPFKNHPFHVNDDEKMAETVESIKTYGVLTPALVRPRPDGGYEMISGHRRKRGCELCGKTTLPALVRNYTDDEAVIIMVDSNIQRENLLPSEKAHAYKMKYDAMKHQGSKGEKYTADMVGEAAGDSGRTVQRYIRLALKGHFGQALAKCTLYPLQIRLIIIAYPNSKQLPTHHGSSFPSKSSSIPFLQHCSTT